jgi:hypothetical protein
MKGESLYRIAELMGNSPEICRKHYAALVPERMHDVVEFDLEPGKRDRDADERNRALMERLIGEVRRIGEERERPRLRLVR